MKRLFIFLFTLALLVFSACKNRQSKEPGVKEEFYSNIPKVRTLIIKSSNFYLDIHSNGKLEALQKVDLKFENEGIIQRIFIKNGSVVKRGEIIARQNSDYLLSEKLKNKEILSKAVLNMEDILLGLGYSLKDSLLIPKETLNMAKSRAGIAEANDQIIQTKKKNNASRIIAPFSGVIADLEAREKSLSSISDKVCTLIDNSKLLVNFYILEYEFGLLSKDDFVEILPIALPNQKFTGKVKYINPIVNENGLILIKAEVENKDNSLIDGMNVNISIRKKIENVISIPKNALIDRQGKKIVFAYKNSKSHWNYVLTGHQNRDSLLIVDGLNIGDTIIVDGNINLAHDIEVELID